MGSVAIPASGNNKTVFLSITGWSWVSNILSRGFVLSDSDNDTILSHHSSVSTSGGSYGTFSSSDFNFNYGSSGTNILTVKKPGKYKVIYNNAETIYTFSAGQTINIPYSENSWSILMI